MVRVGDMVRVRDMYMIMARARVRVRIKFLSSASTFLGNVSSVLVPWPSWPVDPLPQVKTVP